MERQSRKRGEAETERGTDQTRPNAPLGKGMSWSERIKDDR